MFLIGGMRARDSGYGIESCVIDHDGLGGRVSQLMAQELPLEIDVEGNLNDAEERAGQDELQMFWTRGGDDRKSIPLA